MNWVMMVLAILATILLSSKAVKHRKVRLTAFSLWVITNAFWMLFAGDIALQAQFGIYCGLAVWGVWNNLKD